MIDQYIAKYPIPPGTTTAQVFAPITQTLPTTGTNTVQSILDQHSEWVGYYGGLGYSPPTDDDADAGIMARISEAGLSGTIALVAVNAWYHYWLQGTPTQRHKAQATLDNMQTWSDLTFRLGCFDSFTCPGRIVEISRIAQAAADGNPTPMRKWLKDY